VSSTPFPPVNLFATSSAHFREQETWQLAPGAVKICAADKKITEGKISRSEMFAVFADSLHKVVVRFVY